MIDRPVRGGLWRLVMSDRDLLTSADKSFETAFEEGHVQGHMQGSLQRKIIIYEATVVVANLQNFLIPVFGI